MAKTSICGEANSRARLLQGVLFAFAVCALAVGLCIAAPARALAAGEQSHQVEVNGLSYTLFAGSLGRATLADNRGYTGTSLTIPATISVTGEGALWDGTWTVTAVDARAFEGCANLRSVAFASGSYVRSLGFQSFAGTGLSQITLPASVQGVDGNAFRGCANLASLAFAPSAVVARIGEGAFADTALKQVSLPASLQEIDSGAFKGCGQLASVTFAPSGNLTRIGDEVFENTALTSFEVPASVEVLGGRLFVGCDKLASVTFAPNSSLRFLKGTFQNSSITSISLPGSLEEIGENTFARCAKLENVAFAEGGSLKTIGPSAFSASSLPKLTVPASVESIGSLAFERCASLASVTFASGSKLNKLGSDVFANSGLTAIALPKGVTTVESRMFYGCANLKQATLPDGLVSIKYAAFAYSGLTSITVPNSVESIGMEAFVGCKALSRVECAEGKLKSIESRAFSHSGIGGTLTLPASLESIGGQALAYCANLRMVVFKGQSAPAIGDGVFLGSFYGSTFAFYPAAGEASYRAQSDLPQTSGPYDESTARVANVVTNSRLAVIDEANSTIYLSPDPKVDFKNTSLSFAYYGAGISPDPGVSRDYTSPANPVTYTVTAHNGARKTYTVKLGGPYTVSGTVKQDGIARSSYLELRNGTAVFDSIPDTTGGTFTFKNVPPGSYTIEAPREASGGEVWASKPITVDRDLSGIEVNLESTRKNITDPKVTIDGEPYQKTTSTMYIDWKGVIYEWADKYWGGGYFDRKEDIEKFIEIVPVVEGAEPIVVESLTYLGDVMGSTQFQVRLDTSSIDKQQKVWIKVNLPDGYTGWPPQMFVDINCGDYTHELGFEGFDGAFPTAKQGYNASELERFLTLGNLGTAPTGTVALSLEGEHAGSFELSAKTLGSLEPGAESTSVAVSPKAGLAEGAYAATLKAVGRNGAVATLDLSFTVGSKPLQFVNPGNRALVSPLGFPIVETDVSGWASEGVPPYRFSATGLPDGVTMSEAGVLSGTPKKAQQFKSELVAEGADGEEAKLEVYFLIMPPTVSFDEDNRQDYLFVEGDADAAIAAYASAEPAVPLAYQWYQASSPGQNDSGTPIQGATDAVFPLPTDQPEGTYYYYCTASALEAASATSKAVTVRIAPDKGPLTFTDDDRFDIGASVVGTQIRSVVTSHGVSGGVKPYTYSAEGLPQGIAISSASGIISGTPKQAGPAGTATVTVTDAFGMRASIDIAYGQVLATMPRIVFESQPQDIEIVQGSATGSLSVSVVSGPAIPLAYQWYKAGAAGALDPVGGATEAAYALPADLALGKHRYLCEVTGIANTQPLRSEFATVNVVEAPKDEEAPKFSLEDGVTYTGPQTLVVSDDTALASVTVNGVEQLEAGFVGTSATVELADEGAYVVSAKDKAGNAASISFSIELPLADPHFTGIVALSAIAGVANGTPLADIVLPGAVTITTTEGERRASVAWDRAAAAYDPASEAEQTFTVDGAVTLPEGVANPDGLPLATSVSVTVSAKDKVVVTGVAVLSLPGKVDYVEGDGLDLSGLSVSLAYSDGSSATVGFEDFAARGVTTSPAHGARLSVTDSAVNVFAGGKSASFAITVAAAPAQRVSPPAFTPAGGTYQEAQTVEISCATPGADIYYTTDGSAPTAGSTPYAGPLAIDASATIKAIATKAGMQDSVVASATYAIEKPTPPPHEHAWSAWSFDEQEHWRTCECGAEERAGHAFEQWIVDREPTANEAGSRHRDCGVCGHRQTEALDPTGPVFSWRTLADEASGVRVSGRFTSDASLAVVAKFLHDAGACNACDAIRARQEAGQLVALFDVSLASGDYEGELEVELPVGKGLEGRAAVMLHCNDGVLENRAAVVKNGRASGAFASLSPFGVAVDAVSPVDPDPVDPSDPKPINPSDPVSPHRSNGPGGKHLAGTGDAAPFAFAATALLASAAVLIARKLRHRWPA